MVRRAGEEWSSHGEAPVGAPVGSLACEKPPDRLKRTRRIPYPMPQARSSFMERLRSSGTRDIEAGETNKCATSTSFLVPLILPEAPAIPFTHAFGFSTDELAVSDWTRVEIASLLARDVRMHSLDADSALKAARRFESMIAESFTVLLPNRKDYNTAREWLCNFETGLKSGDALHLAIAANHKAIAINSL